MVPLKQLSQFYASQLNEQILPFWLKHAPNREHGGYFTCLDRDGSVYDPDKVCMWSAGRMAWTFAFMYNEFSPNAAWRDFSKLGIDFIHRHGFRADGRMYYGLTSDGRPMTGPDGYHVELSSVLGMSEYARATRDERLYAEARQLFDRVWKIIQDPAGDWSPRLKESGLIRILGYSMITINVLQTLRSYREEPTDAERISLCIDTMRRHHLRPKQKLMLEVVGWNGEDVSGSFGRHVNPGHMIEGGIFVIHEAWHRKDAALRQFGLDLIRWGYEAGWDRQFGGIFNDVDSAGKPISAGASAILADTKLWWQHAEGLYGLLLAYAESRDDWFLKAYSELHDYSFSRFADPEKGEWYAMLDRTGRRINSAKGSDRKNSFHIGRNFLWCHKIAQKFE